MKTESQRTHDTTVEVRTERDDGRSGLPSVTSSPAPAPRPAGACAMAPTVPSFDTSRILRHNGAGWDGVRATIEHDDSGRPTGVTRRILAAPSHASFDIRYFELEPGAEIDLGTHAHTRIMIGQRGHGRIRIAEEELGLGYGDVAHIERGESCRLSNPSPEPFGFICVMSTERGQDILLEVDRADA